jgi:hypothetical protein
MALKHGAHPVVVQCNCLERYATGAKEGPVLCPKILGQTLASRKEKRHK